MNNDELRKELSHIREQWESGVGGDFHRLLYVAEQLMGVANTGTAENSDLQEQIDSLQQKVHLCAGYDRLEAENTRLRDVLETIQALPVRDDYDTLMGYAGAVRAFCHDALAAVEDEQDFDKDGKVAKALWADVDGEGQ